MYMLFARKIVPGADTRELGKAPAHASHELIAK
jgi:hypothetical protein